MLLGARARTLRVQKLRNTSRTSTRMLCFAAHVFRCCREYVYKPAVAVGKKRLQSFIKTHFLPLLYLCMLEATAQKKLF